MITTRLWLPALAWLGATVAAQAPAGTGQVITEERVRDTVTWLAADERLGRATGSPEIAEVAAWIAARFEQAGLVQVAADSWRHEFPLPGWQLDSGAVQLKLVRTANDVKQEFTLEPDHDVRQWKPGDVDAGDEPCTVALSDDPVLQRLLLADSARRPIVCEVAAAHPWWRQAAGTHAVLGSKRQASRPLLLVREGLLPRAADAVEVTWTATWSTAKAVAVDVPQHNVVGLVRGAGAPAEFVVVSAHHDHLGAGAAVRGDRIYNGADDNATGTTGVILVAEALAKLPAPRRSVLFVCFTGEERGLLGSAAFCERPPVPLDQIVANLNLEMIGRPADGNDGKAWLTGAQYSDFAAIAAPALQRAGVGLVEFPMATALFAASDNWSFVQRGIVAHSLSAGSLHRDYHQPSDEVRGLDIPHMTKIVRGLLELTLELANRPAPPQWNEKGREQVARAKR